MLASAERVVQHILNTYSEPTFAPEEIQSRAAKREDPLREFSEICCAELEVMHGQLRYRLGRNREPASVFMSLLKSFLSQHFQQIRHLARDMALHLRFRTQSLKSEPDLA